MPMKPIEKNAYVTSVRLPTDRAYGYAIMKMCEEFARAGASVELIVPQRHGPQGDPFRHYSLQPLFTLRRLSTTDISGKSERITFGYYIDLASFLLSLFFPRFPDAIVYTRDYQVALVARSKHIVLEVHSVPTRSWIFSHALRRVEKFVVITHGIKDALIELGTQKERIFVAPDAVDLAEFDIEPSREEVWREYGVNPQKKIVLYTGHFYEWKGAETLADAATLPPDIEIVLLGGVARELADFKERYSSKHVHIIGFQPREKMPGLLKSADVLVLPNSGKAKISSHYTSPLKLLQYMASGTPIVASDLPSIREILDDSSAYWFTPDDPQSLAARIKGVLENSGEAREKARKALGASKQYTWTQRAKTILGHIASAI